MQGLDTTQMNKDMYKYVRATQKIELSILFHGCSKQCDH